MLSRSAFLIVALALALPLRAQNQPVHMRPEFPLVFPLTNGGKDGKDVTVKYPVMINPATVLKPGTQLRVLYVLSSNAAGGTGDLGLARHGTMEQSYARNAFGANETGEHLSPELTHELENYRRTVWEVPNNFVLAMAQYPTDQMHLIYSPTGRSMDMTDERFSFFDGLFMGLPDGRVTVIAVEKESKTEIAGIKAGDEILAVGGISAENDLAKFGAAYALAKKVAKQNEQTSYTMTVRRQGKGEAEEVNIPLPAKISGNLMNGFFDSDKPQKKEAPAQPAAP